MRRVAGALGVLAALALLLWLLLPRDAEVHAPPPRPGPPAAAEVREPSSAPVPASASTAPAPAPHHVGAGDPAPEEPAKGGLSVSGRVSFPDGRPAPGTWLQASELQTETDESGRYVLAGLEPGEVEVRFLEGNTSKTVEAGAAGVDFVLDAHLVRVDFVDEQGRRFPEGRWHYEGVLVDWHCGGGGKLRSDGPGISVAIPRGARLAYSGKSEGRVQTSGEFVAEGEPALHQIRLTLPPAGETGSLALHALDDRGQPVRNITVEIRDLAGGLLDDWFRKRLDLDSEGRVVLEKVQPGPFVLKTGAGGPWDMDIFSTEMETRVQVQAGRATPVELLLKSGGWIRLTVKDRAGKVLDAGDARVRDEAGEAVSDLFWGQDAKGEWWNPPPGPGPAVFGRPVPPGRYGIEILRGPQLGERTVIATTEALVAWRQICDVEVLLDE
ncbi:MAG: carboxypeptidase-like regulatory domain-containing protein [Planctomycetes bacterium]|nr:carboxypeptidase-like regulatory domain-containing protein [Planctomycetota bacterium]